MPDRSPPRPLPERLAVVAIGIWLGGVSARALALGASPWALPLLALGGAAAALISGAMARRPGRSAGASPIFLFLPLTLLPGIPGWRTLGATAVIFVAALLADRRLALDDPAVARRVLGAAVAAGAVLATALGLLRIYWLADWRYGQDTAYAANLLWNTLHGDFLRSGLLQDLIHSPPLRNDFGAHNSPLQLLLVPLYAIWRSPATLVLARNACLWLAPILLFRHLAPSAGPRAALYVSLALAVQTTVLWQSAHAFYFVQLGLPLLVLLIAAWERQSLAAALGTLVLLLGVREDLSLVALALAGVALLQRRRWPWAVAPAVLGLGWWVLSTRVILPAGGAGAGGAVWSTLQEVGGTPAGILLRALRDPGPLLAAIFRPENREMFLEAGSSVGWVGLAGPGLLIALPFLAINALVDFSPAKEVFAHYHLLPVPFLIVGGFRLLQRAAGERRLAGTLALGLLCVVAAEDVRLLPVAETARALRPSAGALGRQVRRAVAGARSVGAPGAYLPVLSDRPELFLSSRLWRYPGPGPEVVVYDRHTDRANPLPPDRQRYRRWLDDVLEDGSYAVAAELPEGVVILRRTPDG